MNSNVKWVSRQVRLGWMFFAAGMVLSITGIILHRWVGSLPFNARIITAVGILLLGVAFSYLMRYWAAARSPQTAARLASEERDERMQIIRARAGNRAYWFSAILTYAVLMWVSFAQSGSLPEVTDDLLWYLLAGLVILPFGVYAASMVYDQQNR